MTGPAWAFLVVGTASFAMVLVLNHLQIRELHAQILRGGETEQQMVDQMGVYSRRIEAQELLLQAAKDALSVDLTKHQASPYEVPVQQAEHGQ